MSVGSPCVLNLVESNGCNASTNIHKLEACSPFCRNSINDSAKPWMFALGIQTKSPTQTIPLWPLAEFEATVLPMLGHRQSRPKLSHGMCRVGRPRCIGLQKWSSSFAPWSMLTKRLSVTWLSKCRNTWLAMLFAALCLRSGLKQLKLGFQRKMQSGMRHK